MKTVSKLRLSLVDEEDLEEMSDVTVIMSQAELRETLEVEMAIARREHEVHTRPTSQLPAVRVA